MDRRTFLSGLISFGALAMAWSKGWVSMAGPAKADTGFPVTMNDAAWRQKLSPEAYRVLRHEGTEAPFTSALNKEKRYGRFDCAGCDNPLFASSAKFDSGTGWPSFFQPISKNAVGTTTDYKLLYPRTEVHCATCGGHLGHVFDDGPQPTGLRYCMNGAAMRFTSA